MPERYGHPQGAKAIDDNTRVNRRIRAREVRVIREDGEQVGIISVEDALQLAEEAGLDLVEVAPKSRPPVCRIMDYGKFKYQQKKRAHEAKKNQVQIQVKEVKFRPKTEEHDYQFKLAHIQRFIDAGNKVKVTMRFRGREITHQEVALRILQRLGKDIEELAIVESMPKMEGRQMIMLLAPRKDKTK